ncbi:AAA family ATPase [Streptomyces uncialis]|uniref:nSTAND1 domain-containing NTPase n=1 Tax=Streptomyces uncialis TaxID=1048205 RepID=UPI00379D5E58
MTEPENEPAPATPPLQQHAEAGGDHAIVNQAGRDVHTHYHDGPSEAHRVSSPDRTGECPYPGLTPFGKKDARWFFGRKQLTSRLLSEVNERVRSGRPLFVVSPSGAGKSSLLRAGLLASVSDGRLPVTGSADWPQLLLTPTDRPVDTLLRRLAPLTGRIPSDGTVPTPARLRQALREALPQHSAGGDRVRRLLLVVDQLEELFTLCADEDERTAFLDLLTALSERDTDGRDPLAVVVFGLRADFYAPCLGHPFLRAALEQDQLLVGPMTGAEVREAILRPAAVQRLDVEAGLVELLLRDLDTSSGTTESHTYDAGRLPLLAHALQETWQQRHGRTLTVLGYRATGGIQRAVGVTADRAYRSLDQAGQRTAHTVFLRLVRIGESWEDTRRRMSRAELVQGLADAESVREVLDSFTAARLLVPSEDTVEISHEALLRAWPLLRQWINEDRAGHLVRQEIEDTALVWDRDGRDSAALYRGNRLARATDWALSGRGGAMSTTASAFLTASVRHRTRAVRRRQGLVAVLVVLTLVASVTAVVAFRQTNAAERERDLAIANQITAVADRIRGSDATLAARLDVTAHRMNPTDASYIRLLKAGAMPLYEPLPGWQTDPALSRDGRTLATETRGAIQLWDISDTSRPRVLGRIPHERHVEDLEFSPDGRVLAVTSLDSSAGTDLGLLQLWNVSDTAKPRPLGEGLDGPTGPVDSLAFSPDGRLLAGVSDKEDTTWMWQLDGLSRPVLLSDPLEETEGPLDFTADSGTLVTLLANGSEGVGLWDVTEVRAATLAGRVENPVGDRTGEFALSADGRSLVTNSLFLGRIDPVSEQVGTVQVWDISRRPRPVRRGADFEAHTGGTSALALNSDATTLVTGGLDGDRTMKVWSGYAADLPSQVGVSLSGHDEALTSAEFSDDGRTLVSAAGQQVFLWRMPPTVLTGHGSVRATASSRDGRLLATIGEDDIVQLWDVADPTAPRRLGRLRGGGRFAYGIAFSPDDRTLAATARISTDPWESRIRLWDISDPTRPAPHGEPFGEGARELRFSEDGKELHSEGRRWDITTLSRPVGLGSVDKEASSPWGDEKTLVVSPDRKRFALLDDRSIQVGVGAGRDGDRLVGKPLTGHTGRLTTAVFSPTGDLLATGDTDNIVRLWRVDQDGTASPLGDALTGHAADVNSLSFLAEGAILASGSDDGTLRIWDLDGSAAADRLCAATADNVARARWPSLFGDTPYRPACEGE